MLAGGALSDAVGYHRTFQYLSVATSVGLIAAVVLSETRPGIAADPDRVETSQARVKWLNQWKHAIQGARALDSRLWLAAGLNLIGRFFGSGVIVSTLGLYLSEQVPVWSTSSSLAIGVASLTGLLLFLRSLVSVGSAPTFGHLSDVVRSRLLVTLLGLALITAAYLSLALGFGPWGVVVAIILAALSDGAFPTSLGAWIGDVASDNQRGKAVALYATLGDAGAGFAPLAAYAIAAAYGLESLYLLCVGVLVVCLAGIAWGTKKRILAD